MKELNDILQAWREMTSTAALATVVRVQGSAYRRSGARMLIAGDGSAVGGVSGGCLERDVIQRAGSVMQGDRPVLVRYDTSLDPEGGSGYSLGCGGAIDVLIEPLNTPAGVGLMEWLAASQLRPGVMATVISQRHPSIPLGQRMMIDESTAAGSIGTEAFSQTVAEAGRLVLSSGRSTVSSYSTSGGTIEIFFELLNPPLDLLIFGGGSDAVPLVQFARALGWRVTVVDVRSAALDPGRVWEADAVIRCNVDQVADRVVISDCAAAVVMTHNFKHDSKLVRWLVSQPLRYLGLLGPRHRAEQVLAGAAAARLHSPVGLDIGADNPQEVALAIVAEITAVLRGRSGVPLSATDGPIHVGHPSPRKAAECPAAAS
jgi:xanthine/CO dehydrogenase XdhC/CoxF family maturation factor